MKKIFYLLCGILLLSCEKESTTSPESEKDTSPKPEFVLKQIQCSFREYTNIYSAKKDTIVLTQMNYGLDAYYHLKHGLISKQIISFNGYKDTIMGSSVDSKPDNLFAPVLSQQFTIPNILHDLDSVKIVVQIYGSFFNDSTLQKPISNFYYCDSVNTYVLKYVFVRP